MTQDFERERKRKMEAYLVLLHLKSQGYATLTDMRYLFGWDESGFRQGHAISILAEINQKILALSQAWGEEIPRINALVFKGDGSCTESACKEIFGMLAGDQPTPRQIAKLSKKVTSYEKWDAVLAAFRADALPVMRFPVDAKAEEGI